MDAVVVVIEMMVMVGLVCRRYGPGFGCGILRRLPWWMKRQLDFSGRR